MMKFPVALANSAVLSVLLIGGCAPNQGESAPANTSELAKTPAPVTAPAIAATPLPVNFDAYRKGKNVQMSPIALGYAQTSVNTVVFRVSSVITHGDTQFAAFYDGDANLVLTRRKTGANKWETRKTQYQGNVKDAHNSISMGVDGQGILHVAWDMHGQKLRYARGKAPDSLELGAEMPMTGQDEESVTYPQFYVLPGGDLLFLYRAGGSGNGDTVLNRYDLKTGKWKAIARPLISGEGKRNAYTNTLAIDAKGGVHLSWVWRETPDVASNHDINYAYSPDSGATWLHSSGQKYQLPITQSTAEIAWKVPQNSELINQTSMTTDAGYHPVIATYWRDQNSKIPQYRIVWNDGKKWSSSIVGQRTMPFSLSGGGTKRIPISRPQVVAGKDGAIHVIFRDEERGAEVSVATSRDAAHQKWSVQDLLYPQPIQGMVGVGTYDTQAQFKDVRVTKNGKTLFASDFTKPLNNWKTLGGDWKTANGVLTQASDAKIARVLIGQPTWSDYTMTLAARKTGGNEGFLIVFGSPGGDSKVWWNLGGWGNRQHALEMPGGGATNVPGKIETGRWYQVKIELQGARVRCYLDGKLVQSGARTSAWEPSYDIEKWKRAGKLDLFYQNVGQGDGEKLQDLPPQPVGVLEWRP